MNETSHTIQDRLLAAQQRGRPLVLLLDYDGTLVPLAAHPQTARLGEGTRQLLSQLARHPQLTLGVISGRALDDVRHHVGLTELYYAGSSGLELDLLGKVRTASGMEHFGKLRPELTYRLQTATTACAGAWVEVKEYGLTVHDRNAPRAQVPHLRAAVRQALHPWGRHLRSHEGHSGIEIIPACGWTKGTAVRAIVSQIGSEAMPFYAGDDTNDTDALTAAAELGGIALGIGPHAPATAQFRLSGPTALESLLRNLHHALTPHAPTPFN